MSVKLLKDLNFTEIINGTNAVTEAGKDMLSNYRGYVYSNPVSCTVVNNFVKEASNFGFDTGLSSILESVTKFISENNISWKLATACEYISNNFFTYNENIDIATKIHKSSKTKHNLIIYKEDDIINEGKAGHISTKTKSRSDKLRKAAIDFYKTSAGHLKCCVCGFDFEETYGNLGKDYIQILWKISIFIKAYSRR